MKAKLRAPQLRVVKGIPNGLNNHCVPNSYGTTLILIGASCTLFCITPARCGHRVKVFNSYRNRHCPKCQATARAKCELLPVPYFHVVSAAIPI